MKTKITLSLIIGVILFSSLVIALNYGYINQDGSGVIFDEGKKIIGVYDNVQYECRLPTGQEKIKNDYIPMSSQKTLAECLTNKGSIFYGAYWCPHCANQKALFKEDAINLPYFECEDDKQTCIDAGIKAYPTWKINGVLYEGEKSLEELSNLSGCPLN